MDDQETPIEVAERKRKRAALDAASQKLMDDCAFESVIILATYRTESASTMGIKSDRGNWYAQNGHMREVLRERDEATRLNIRESQDD